MSESFYMDVAEHVKGVVEASVEGFDPVPRVTVGGSSDVAPFDVLVREAPANLEFSDVTSSHATMGRSSYAGCCTCQFDVNVEMVATRATVVAAADTLLSWLESFVGHLLADRTLGGLVEHSAPVSQPVYTAEANRKYMAGVTCAVRCRKTVNPILKEE